MSREIEIKRIGYVDLDGQKDTKPAITIERWYKSDGSLDGFFALTDVGTSLERIQFIPAYRIQGIIPGFEEVLIPSQNLEGLKKDFEDDRQ